MINLEGYIQSYRGIADDADEKLKPLTEQAKEIEKERTEKTDAVTTELTAHLESDKESMTEMVEWAESQKLFDTIFQAVDMYVSGELPEGMDAMSAMILRSSLGPMVFSTVRKNVIRNYVGNVLQQAFKADAEMDAMFSEIEGGEENA